MSRRRSASCSARRPSEAVLAEAERVRRQARVRHLDALAGAEEDGPLQRIERALGSRHVGTYATIKSHSPREDVVAGATAARAAKADLLVAVGGGSVIDATKAMQLCLWVGLDTPEAMEPYCVGLRPQQAARRSRCRPTPIRMISVSTTLSASEFTENAGITQSATNTKQSFRHRLFAPRTVVLDPAATLDTPDWLLFCTGIRAVDHAVENYCNARASPATEALSLQGLKLLSRALPAIKRSPSDLAPRLEAQFGMWQAIAPSAAGVPTGASHGIGYALGATFGVAHGHTSCVMLHAVLKWNAAVNGERQRALSEAMGEPGRPAQRSGARAGRGPRAAGDAAGGRHQAREPRRDRAPRAQLPAGATQPAADQDGRGRQGDPGACLVSGAEHGLQMVCAAYAA